MQKKKSERYVQPKEGSENAKPYLEIEKESLRREPQTPQENKKRLAHSRGEKTSESSDPRLKVAIMR